MAATVGKQGSQSSGRPLVTLMRDGETVEIIRLEVQSAALHGQLQALPATKHAAAVRNALELGVDVAQRAGTRVDVDQLDLFAGRIMDTVTEHSARVQSDLERFETRASASVQGDAGSIRS